MLTWDEAKRRKNLEKHGIDFAELTKDFLSLATNSLDDRFSYGEVREIALGPFRERIHVLVYTRRDSDIHVISLRKANKREIARYVQARKAV